MESPTECIRQWFHRWFRRWNCHVTIRLSRFESAGHFVGKIVWKNSTSPHCCIFPNKLYRPSVIRSVYTDGIFRRYIPTISPMELCYRYIPTTDGVMLSVYTDRIEDGIISISKNYRWKNFIGNSIGFRWFSGNNGLYIVDDDYKINL